MRAEKGGRKKDVEEEGEEEEDAVDRTCRLPRRGVCCMLREYRGLLYAPATRCSAVRHDVSP